MCVFAKGSPSLRTRHQADHRAHLRAASAQRMHFRAQRNTSLTPSPACQRVTGPRRFCTSTKCRICHRRAGGVPEGWSLDPFPCAPVYFRLLPYLAHRHVARSPRWTGEASISPAPDKRLVPSATLEGTPRSDQQDPQGCPRSFAFRWPLLPQYGKLPRPSRNKTSVTAKAAWKGLKVCVGRGLNILIGLVCSPRDSPVLPLTRESLWCGLRWMACCQGSRPGAVVVRLDSSVARRLLVMRAGAGASSLVARVLSSASTRPTDFTRAPQS